MKFEILAANRLNLNPQLRFSISPKREREREIPLETSILYHFSTIFIYIGEKRNNEKRGREIIIERRKIEWAIIEFRIDSVFRAEFRYDRNEIPSILIIEKFCLEEEDSSARWERRSTNRVGSLPLRVPIKQNYKEFSL